MLEEFDDAILNDLPTELSPMRNIQHHIDLIPSASLLNVSHYNMGFKKNKILRRTICAVLTLLTPKKFGS